MPSEPTRRRLLQILAATLAGGVPAAARAEAVEWRGSALGAEVSIVFAGADRNRAEAAIAEILAEIDRLEAIFSLQRGDSELRRLDAAGRLAAPSPDLVHVLATARRVHAATAGRFDPTVQALWDFHMAWYAGDRSRERPSEADLAAARATVGFDRVGISGAAIEMPAGTRLTLDGIAQGHVTDRASLLLRRAGFDRVLVDLGEIRALGPRADDAPWRIGLGDGREIALADGAVATSAPGAFRFADNGDHHLFDPVTGRPARFWQRLTVAHASATVADGFSTGLSALPAEAAVRIVAATPGLRLWGRTAAGEPIAAGCG